MDIYTPLERARQEQARRLADAARVSLAAFVRASWPFLEQGMPLSWSWHHDAICEHLEALYRGEITRLAIAIPPRHSKSTIISVAFPAWVWINSPYERFLTTSYSLSLAIRDAERSRSLMEGEWYQAHYGESFEFSSSQNVKSWYRNNHGGTRIATSVQSSATGEGAQYCFCDDPHNIMDVESEIVRDRTNKWWDSVMGNRLNDQKTGRMVIVAQRSHKYDLIGHVLAQGGYDYLCLPAEYDPSRKTYTSIGWTDPRQEEGEPLWEEKFPKSVLEERKRIMQTDYFAQFQQLPQSHDGAIIKQSHIRRYHLLYPDMENTHPDQMYVLAMDDIEKEYAASQCRFIITSDFAVSVKQLADFSVFLLWAVTPDYNAILLDGTVEKVTGPEAEEIALSWCKRYKRRLFGIVIEDVAYQKSIIQRFMREGVPVIAYTPKGDKTARAHSIAVYFKAGQFYFPSVGFSLLGLVIVNITEFPGVEHDDIMDAVSILIAIYQGRKPNMRDISTKRAMTPAELRIIEGEKALRRDNPELYHFIKAEEGVPDGTIGTY